MLITTNNDINLTNNVAGKDLTDKYISNTLGEISSILANTLGPFGANTMLQDNMMMHSITKDGYSVLKKICYKDDIPLTILTLITRISRTLVQEVGDGSTSSIIISNAIYNYIKLRLSEYPIPSQVLLNCLNLLSDKLTVDIKNKSVKIEDKDINKFVTKMATVSTNNDIETGMLIGRLFEDIGRYGRITLETSNTEKDWYEKVKGAEINRGMIHPIFTNQKDGYTCKLEGVRIFMSNDTLDDNDLDLLTDMVGKICLAENTALLIIAPSYTESVKAFFIQNKKSNPNLPLVAIDMAVSQKRTLEYFEDISIITDSRIYNKKFDNSKFTKCEWLSEDDLKELTEDELNTTYNLNSLGQCKSIEVNEILTTIIGGASDKELVNERVKKIEERIKAFETQMDNIDREESIFNMKKRIATLTDSMVKLYVGGKSESEKDTRKYLIEDAVSAAKSMLVHGYVTGGNLIAPIILDEKKDDYIATVFEYIKNYSSIFNTKNFAKDIVECLFEAILESFRTVLRNAKLTDEQIETIIRNCLTFKKVYNLMSNTIDYEDNIINSAYTDISIIKSSISIIGLLATTNQFVSTNYLKK